MQELLGFGAQSMGMCEMYGTGSRRAVGGKREIGGELGLGEVQGKLDAGVAVLGLCREW